MAQRATLLVNLGSPASTLVADVRRYLREFLMDDRVIDSPWLVRWLVVHLAILPRRPKESAHAYGRIWTAQGSPLILTSQAVQAALRTMRAEPVELAMRYGKPSIGSVIETLCRDHPDLTELCLVPLYPHYAMSSFETCVVRVEEVLRRRASHVRLRTMPPCYAHPEYLEAMLAVTTPYLQQPHDHVLFSFHGVPERHIRKGDPTGRHCLQHADCCTAASAPIQHCYRAQCLATVRALAPRLGLTAERYSVAFQSRLGRDPWLQPFTDVRLAELARAGVRRLLVLCPSFVADCLETLEEIALRGAETFQSAGGESLQLIPCLNEHPRWIAALNTMIDETWVRARRCTPPNRHCEERSDEAI